jgi:putative transmembrane protein PGPGW
MATSTTGTSAAITVTTTPTIETPHQAAPGAARAARLSVTGATLARGAIRYHAPSSDDGVSSFVPWRGVWRWTRKIVILVVGVALLLAGAAMLVLPGPGVLVILMGFGLLATEYPWARKVLMYLRDRARQVLGLLRRGVNRLRGKPPH